MTTANDMPSLEGENNIKSNYPIVSPNYQIDIDQKYADDIEDQNEDQKKIIKNRRIDHQKSQL